MRRLFKWFFQKPPKKLVVTIVDGDKTWYVRAMIQHKMREGMTKRSSHHRIAEDYEYA